jgi:hypothetical protein
MAGGNLRYNGSFTHCENIDDMSREPVRVGDVLRNPAMLWGMLRDYLGLGRRRRLPPVNDLDRIREFLNTRASYVSQVSLYGYLRTRTGMRYPELFDDDVFVESINIAKWQVWLACLSDLAVYAGGLLMQHPRALPSQVTRLIQEVVADILEHTGIPDEAGDRFAESADHLRQRLAHCDWRSVTDDEAPFLESPAALVEWAPVMEELKQLDDEIVKNSVRFRWQSVRRELRRALDAGALLGCED